MVRLGESTLRALRFVQRNGGRGVDAEALGSYSWPTSKRSVRDAHALLARLEGYGLVRVYRDPKRAVKAYVTSEGARVLKSARRRKRVEVKA